MRNWRTLIFLFLALFLLGSLPFGAGAVVVRVYVDNPLVPPLPEPSPGGGGSTPLLPTRVSFSGRGYPGEAVTLLKDGQEALSRRANVYGQFEFSLEEVAPGHHLFSLFGTDRFGRRSALVSLPLDLLAGSLTAVTNVVLPPTLSLDKQSVVAISSAEFFGQSVIPGNVELTIDALSPRILFAPTGSLGEYRYQFTPAGLNLPVGRYSVRARTFFSSGLSPLSLPVTLFVGEREEILPPPPPGACPDLSSFDFNGDCQVNLVDFSILVYWLGRPGPPAELDFNSDGRVDLTDFSVLAFYWTG